MDDKDDDAGGIPPMSGAELMAALVAIGTNQRRFARFAGLSDRNVNRWATDKLEVPQSVAVLVALMMRCDAWRHGADWRDWPPAEDQPR
jgi:hypothetical protein